MTTRIYNICVRYFVILSLTLLVYLAFSIDQARAEDEYIYILRAKGNPYWNTIAQGIEETAKATSAHVTVYQSESESSAEEQLNTCLAAIQRKPKVLAIAAANMS